MLQNFRTYNLAIQFHKDCQSLRFKPIFRDQFDRAILSVVLNLAEGAAKPTPKDRRRFYCISMGSLREVQTILQLTGYERELKLSDPLAASLYRLIQNTGP